MINDREKIIIELEAEVRQLKEENYALKQTEKKYREIFSDSLAAIYTFNEKMEFADSNRAGTELLGYSKDELLKLEIRDVHIDSKTITKTYKKIFDGYSLVNNEQKFRRKDGTTVTVLNNSLPLFNGKGEVTGAQSFLFDISELKTAIEDLEKAKLKSEESEQKYRSLFNSTGDAIAIHDMEGNFLEVNREFCDRLGYEEKEILNTPILRVDSPKFAKKIPMRFKELLANGQARFETEHICKNGRTIPAEVQAKVIEFEKKQAILSVVRDITERKRVELEREVLESSLQRAKKMEAIGLMAGGVAHDLNNILSGIVGYPEILLMQLPEDSKMRKPIQIIHESGKRAAAVVADMLTVARGVVAVKESINLNALIDEYLESPEALKIKSLHSDVSIETLFEQELFNIVCSPIHVRKCIMNLVTNAAEAIVGDGIITISTQSRYVEKPIKYNHSIEKGDWVVITVSDSGPGIPEKNLDQIFEPFYTKKIMGKSGTGLGLSVVWNTVNDHGGGIVVTSSDKGTNFELYFPADRTLKKAEIEQTDKEQYYGKGEEILFVDDELLQQDIASKMLSLFGYRVHTVSSGEEAIEFMRKQRADLVILDMIMDPGINGKRL